MSRYTFATQVSKMKIGNQGVLNTSVFKHAENRQDAKFFFIFFLGTVQSSCEEYALKRRKIKLSAVTAIMLAVGYSSQKKGFFFLFFFLRPDAKVGGNRIELPYVGALYRHTCIFIPSFFLRRYYMCDVYAISK